MSCSLNSKGSGIIMNMKSTDSAFYTILGPSTCSSLLTQYNYIRLAAIGFKATGVTLDIELESSNRSDCTSKEYFVLKPVTVTKWISVAGIEYGETKLTDYIDPSLGSNPLTYNHAIGLLSFTKLNANFTFLALSLERYSISSMTSTQNSPVQTKPSASISILQSESGTPVMESSQSNMLYVIVGLSSVAAIAIIILSCQLVKRRISRQLPLQTKFDSSTEQLDMDIVRSNFQDKLITSQTSISNNLQYKDNHPRSLKGSHVHEATNLSTPTSKGFLTHTEDTNTSTFQSTISNQLTIAIPGYLNLVWGSDFVILEAEKSIGKGGTSSILNGALTKPELIRKFKVSQVAVKIIKNDQSMTEDILMENFLFEIALISSLPPSPNIVGLIGYTTTPCLAMIMKLYPMSVSTLVKHTEIVISPETALWIARDIANGMEIIHRNGIMHLDLKPANILVEVSEDGSFWCAICDFGFASICGGSRPVAKGINVPKTVGITVRYSAPEVFTHLKSKSGEGRVTTEIDKKIDVYAYAITMYEILAKRSAWGDVSKNLIIVNVKSNLRPPFMEDSSITEKYAQMPSLLKIVTEGWKQKPEERPSFETILQWLKVDIDITKGGN